MSLTQGSGDGAMMDKMNPQLGIDWIVRKGGALVESP